MDRARLSPPVAALLLASGVAAAQGIRLNRELPRGFPDGGQDVGMFRVGPDGAWVVYTADEAIEGVFDLYSAPADGSAAPRRRGA